MEEPKSPQTLPYVLEVEAGTYAWCACGRSESQPYCDGSHSGTGFSPVIEKIDEKRRVAWCGCKKSGNGAMCDGSHARM